MMNIRAERDQLGRPGVGEAVVVISMAAVAWSAGSLWPPRAGSGTPLFDSPLHRLVRSTQQELVATLEDAGLELPTFVDDALARFVGCGVASAGFVRLRSTSYGAQRALPFSCDPQNVGSVARGQDGRSD